MQEQKDYWQPDNEQNSPDNASELAAAPQDGVQQADEGGPDQPDHQGGKYAGYDLTDPTAAGGQTDQEQVPQEGIQWEASEYIHHEKGVLWFVVLGAITVVLGGVAIWLQAWTFLALLLVMVIALVVYANRPPRTLHYSLSQNGLTIDNRQYQYEEFKAFGIQHDGAFYSVVLIPTKRFMPAVNMFFDEKDGEEIVDILGSHLPMQKMEPDMLDQLFKKLRF